MLGIFYVILIFLLGRELAPGTVRLRPWLLLPVSFGRARLLWAGGLILFPCWQVYVWGGKSLFFMEIS